MTLLPPAEQRLKRLAPLPDILAVVDTFAAIEASEVDVGEAVDRVLASEVRVTRAVPSQALALRDGWAVDSEAVADAGPYAPVAMASPHWVEAGDPLPPSTDAVLAPDAITVSGATIEVMAPVVPGEGTLSVGADAEPARMLRFAGTHLRSIDVAALRIAGVDRVSVRMPHLRIVVANRTIKESVDAVGPLIVGAVEHAGGVAQLDWASREPEALERALGDVEAHAVIAIGGTGVGRSDSSVRLLAGLGRVDIHGMALRPGESTALGAVGSRPVLLLPGRPDAALAAWLIVGRRLLARLAGSVEPEAVTRERLVRKIVSAIGIAEMVPVGWASEGVEPLASGYIPAQALARASGWVFVPPESEGFPAGAEVELRSFP